METLAWIGFTHSIFGALLLLAKRNIHISDKILVSWLAISAITFLEIAISKAQSFSITPVNVMITNVLLFLYSLSLTKENFKLKSSHFYHSLLPVVFILVIVWTGAKLKMDEYFFEDIFLPYRIILAICLILSFFLYWTLSIRIIHKYRLKLKTEYSSIDSATKLGWLLFVLIFYILYNLVLIITGFIEVFSAVETNYIFIILSFQLLLVLTFTFYGFRHQVGHFIPDDIPSTPESYSQSRMIDSEKMLIKQKLITYFEKNEPYLNRELTVTILANQLKVQRHKLTEVLNVELKMNFYQFVNEYRIKKVKEMLVDPANSKLSIEAIGYDCGFNSKSTFFTVFKNAVGITPSQYQQKHHKQTK